MTLIDIISKATRYAKKVIVNDNSSTGNAVSIESSPTGGEITLSGASSGKFSFTNTSTAATKATVFTGANVGINEINPQTTFHVGGVATIGRQDTSFEGGEIRLLSAINNQLAWYIDAWGSTTNPFFRIVNGVTSTIRFIIDGTSGYVGIGTGSPRSTLNVFGTVTLENLPTFANNAAAIAGGLISNDVYKTATGELRIVV
jgi:hypothetical protein